MTTPDTLLYFDYELTPHPGGDGAVVRGAELRATWGRLVIRVGNSVVSRHVTQSRRMNDSLDRPLYPLAEWIVMQWWSLLYEPDTPERPSAHSYASRHALRYASEGFALPDLRFIPQGDTVRLEWHPRKLPFAHVEFIESGSVELPRYAVEQACRRFVTAVVDDLRTAKLHGTDLETEADALFSQRPTQDAFCRAAGLVGLDPYDLPPGMEGVLLALEDRLPDEAVRDEFLSVADADQLDESAGDVAALLGQASRKQTQSAALAQAAALAPSLTDLSRDPWAQGYALAQRARTWLDPGGEGPRSLAKLRKTIGLPTTVSLQADHAFPGGVRAVHGRSRKPGHLPVLLPYDADTTTTRFLFARVLAEHLMAPGEPALVTDAATRRQKRNRAFAAELLAPADWLREQIRGTVSNHTIQRLADELGVSSRLVEHQIVNHHIAQLPAVELPRTHVLNG